MVKGLLCEIETRESGFFGVPILSINFCSGENKPGSYTIAKRWIIEPFLFNTQLSFIWITE